MQRRRWRQLSKTLRRPKSECCLIVVVVLLLLWLLLMDGRSYWQSDADISTYCSPIDVVYTWVNGSDPLFVEAIRRFDATYDPARFDDKNELLYSLRSLERYAPWVRHVYIVTNGQIPHWLDLSYERVTVVPHDAIAPKPLEQLPTFSSAAIETFLHRIPQLSQRFLYMNDDVFLGQPLHPDDLYTVADGVRVYQVSWLVPDCGDDCPWTYIGDGVCDAHCNTADCQYDGGDCSSVTEPPARLDDGPPVHHAMFPLLHTPKRGVARSNSSLTAALFKDVMLRQRRNISTLHELRHIVDSYNKRLRPGGALDANSNGSGSRKGSPPKPVATTPSMRPRFAGVNGHTYKSTKDVYSHSLMHTNRLLNRHYGFQARNVLAHAGFLLQRDILQDMQLKFADEVAATAAHRFRAPDDLQLAFVYYHYLMGETLITDVAELFDELDTDGSGTWSDSELRTLLARLFPLPLDWSALHYFEEVIGNCSHASVPSQGVQRPTAAYERYADSQLPTITRELVLRCSPLADALHANFAVRPRYKYHLAPKRSTQSNFMMLTSNLSVVVESLDKLRREPRKFNCINDNLEPPVSRSSTATEETHDDSNDALIRQLLEDFYRSFFPRRSKFELQAEYRNRFAFVADYQRWRRRKRAVLFLGYSVSLLLLLFLIRFVCAHKAKFARRYVQRL